MSVKLNNQTLIILSLVLAGLIAWIFLSEDRKSESTFQDVFAEIDTSAVKEIRIYPLVAQRKEIRIFKTGKRWHVKNETQEALVDDQTVKSLFSIFAKIKSRSLAAASENQWEQFQVGDSTANRIIFITPEKSFDIMIGKFTFDNETHGATSYIRMKNQKEVYAVEGFLAFSVNQPFNSWRDKFLFKSDGSDLNKITFLYPADSGFVLLKDSARWLINGQTVNNEKAFINEISFLAGEHFAKAKITAPPVYSVSFDNNNHDLTTIHFYEADSINKFFVTSTINPQTVFSDPDLALFKRLLKSRNYF
ncbi:MAG: DUF4340 domain-containing protein [Bacteroidia bacterium]|nr:DUF4340 domain-containing protein [Bacteroidia bacterium]MCZ2277126.1 DUF4340 domain-containing protein [Bacteroidia bacterium]